MRKQRYVDALSDLFDSIRKYIRNNYKAKLLIHKNQQQCEAILKTIPTEDMKIEYYNKLNNSKRNFDEFGKFIISYYHLFGDLAFDITVNKILWELYNRALTELNIEKLDLSKELSAKLKKPRGFVKFIFRSKLVFAEFVDLALTGILNATDADGIKKKLYKTFNDVNIDIRKKAARGERV
ncbi:MAG: hypothetical protein ACI4DP_11305 [Candidatus Ornithomonoglobus sp.]